MAHIVLLEIPQRSLGRSDVKFKVKKDGSMFGTLEVSKGSLVWFPKDVIWGHKIGWDDFDKIMRKKPREERR